MKHESTNEPVAWMNPNEQNVRKAFHWIESEEFTSAVYTHPQDQKKDEALRLALEALKDVGYAAHKSLITLIKQALENK